MKVPLLKGQVPAGSTLTSFQVPQIKVPEKGSTE